MQKKMKSVNWIEDNITKKKIIDFDNPYEEELIKKAIKTAYLFIEKQEHSIGRVLASTFDLIVATHYYSLLSHSGWFYCPSNQPRLFFPYTNCCPRDAITNKYHFHKSNKPQSGKIGTITARLLLLFYQEIFSHLNKKEKCYKGKEPIDAIIINEETKNVIFAEIKASPLITPALSVMSQKLTIESDGFTQEKDHSGVDNIGLYNAEMEIFVPKQNDDKWFESYYILGKKKNAKDLHWSFKSMTKLLDNETFFKDYYNFWSAALESYQPRDTNSIFWLTNACGTPSPTPVKWPKRRRGSGYESISDSKTSVGMDRTDDLKKGIYQVLKIGSEGKPIKSAWNMKTAILSNIHAARHFEDYLDSLKNIVWTIDITRNAKKISDLPQENDLYNLFDGVIALTFSYSRDKWVQQLFEFDLT
jgi:hypothetical protein